MIRDGEFIYRRGYLQLAFLSGKGGGAALIERLTTPGRLNNGETLDCAFGLGFEEYQGLRMISHAGAFVGYRAEMIRFPEQGFSVD